MAKTEFFCNSCKKVRGGEFGALREKYKCAKCKDICLQCVTRSGFFTSKYTCQKCGGECLKYEYNSKRNRYEKA
jgi:hypothetical protein